MTNEEILIQKSQAGDLAAFDELIKPYENRLYNFLAKMCNNHEAAQDMVQETFLNVFKKIKSYRAEAKFSTWLFQIATNNCLMLKRKSANLNHYSLDENPEHPFEIIDLQKTPEEKYTQEELQNIVEEALQKLEPSYRSVFILSEVDGFSGPEIASILKITLPNVKA
jgi:RNA polymerase sigma-70 factor (ECF subfamily)